MATAKKVKDVSPHEFVKAYSAHLKRSGKVLYISLDYLFSLDWKGLRDSIVRVVILADI